MPPKRKAVAFKDEEAEDESSKTAVTVTAKKAKTAPAKGKAAAASATKKSKSKASAAEEDVDIDAILATAVPISRFPLNLNQLITAADWQSALAPHFSSSSWTALCKFVESAYQNSTVFPPRNKIFAALNTTPLSSVKVVIIGQDPYFNAGQAMGLSFSIPRGVKLPPSLARIYKVLEKTIPKFKAPAHGDLTEWAQRGVLLLNASLTVESGTANSHAKAGWLPFTNCVIDAVASQRPHVVFLSWGGFAQKLTKSVDRSKHLVIEDPHPSPMSGAAFNATSPFAQINAFLESKKIAPIDWTVTH